MPCRRNPSRGNYYVHIREGGDEELLYGPFDWRGAVYFARIGAEYGEADRIVTRGKFGEVIRHYRGQA